MFLDRSRYAKVETVETRAAGGRTVIALKLRRLAAVAGEPYLVKDNDRLDLIAQDRYAEATRYWLIGDANSALDARTLLDETGATIAVPRG